MNSTGDNATEVSLYPIELVIPFTIVYGVIFLTGVVGNVSTCVVIARNKSMHTATNYYLFSLAVSDMVLLISGLPPEMYRIWSPDTYIFGEVFCFLQGFSAETSANATVLTITAFTAERYLAICHPFLSHTMSKLSRAVKIIIIIWTVALCLAIPQAIQFGIEYESLPNGQINSHCTVVKKTFEHAFEVSTFVFFVAPMTLITVLYVIIGVQLKKSTGKRPGLTLTSQNESARKKIRATMAQNRVIKMLIAVVAAFFICWAPFHAQRLFAVYLAGASKEAQNTHFNFYLYLMYTSGVLYFVSTTINPILYHLMSNKYRKEFKKTFNNLCRRKITTNSYQFRQHNSLRVSNKNDFLDFASNRSEKASEKSASCKFSPQTSQSSFSSSKIDEANKTSNKIIKVHLNDGRNHTGCAQLKQKMFRLFRIRIANSYLYQSPGEHANNISNSSLKDTEDMDFVCAELVKHMQEVNELL